MIEHLPGWAVYLDGEKIDLDDLRDLLKSPWSPWVEDDDEPSPPQLMLRSRAWDVLTDPREVSQQADRLVRMINGAKPLLYSDSVPVKCGGVVKFRTDGKRENVFVLASGLLTLGQGRMRARAATNPLQPPVESRLQKWMKDADHNDRRAELFLHLARADNWFDIYKVAELLKKLIGRTHLQSALGSNWPDFRRLLQTANFHRHAPGTNPPPAKPFQLKEAVTFLHQIIPTLL